MKSAKRMLSLIMMCVILCSSFSVSAAETTDIPQELMDIPEDAILIESYDYMESDNIVTVKKYQLEDGTIMTDTFSRNEPMFCSANGTDTATRTRDLSTWGTISLTARFTWKTEGNFSYVKCDSASASSKLVSGTVVDKWDVTRTSDFVAIGKAKAQVEYYIYSKSVPTSHSKGTFSITCSDTGTISDN